MKSVSTTILVAVVTLFPWQIASAAECQAVVDVCFRPGRESCADRIAAMIDGARQTIRLQAYGFTSKEIAASIVKARKRGIEVRAILDKSNRSDKYSVADFLGRAGAEVRIDDSVTIAHNKIIVIDGNMVVGGSYNFTSSAEKRNAENVTFIRSSCVAERYLDNFEVRWRVAAPYNALNIKP
ncbi:MAG: phospholipase D family protein [Rhodospirillales bacterium]|nr:phospholipase D family protein [Rhodospirillales bacterium]